MMRTISPKDLKPKNPTVLGMIKRGVALFIIFGLLGALATQFGEQYRLPGLVLFMLVSTAIGVMHLYTLIADGTPLRYQDWLFTLLCAGLGVAGMAISCFISKNWYFVATPLFMLLPATIAIVMVEDENLPVVPPPMATLLKRLEARLFPVLRASHYYLVFRIKDQDIGTRTIGYSVDPKLAVRMSCRQLFSVLTYHHNDRRNTDTRVDTTYWDEERQEYLPLLWSFRRRRFAGLWLKYYDPQQPLEEESQLLWCPRIRLKTGRIQLIWQITLIVQSYQPQQQPTFFNKTMQYDQAKQL